ncbi:hypothetical protein Avbf_04207, partial [Armadillidium vulgare]
ERFVNDSNFENGTKLKEKKKILKFSKNSKSSTIINQNEDSSKEYKAVNQRNQDFKSSEKFNQEIKIMFEKEDDNELENLDFNSFENDDVKSFEKDDVKSFENDDVKSFKNDDDKSFENDDNKSFENDDDKSFENDNVKLFENDDLKLFENNDINTSFNGEMNHNFNKTITSTGNLVLSSLSDLVHNLPAKITKTNDFPAKINEPRTKSKKVYKTGSDFFKSFDSQKERQTIHSSCIPLGSNGKIIINGVVSMVGGKNTQNKTEECRREVENFVENNIKVPSMNTMQFVGLSSFYFVAASTKIIDSKKSFGFVKCAEKPSELLSDSTQLFGLSVWQLFSQKDSKLF